MGKLMETEMETGGLCGCVYMHICIYTYIRFLYICIDM